MSFLGQIDKLNYKIKPNPDLVRCCFLPSGLISESCFYVFKNVSEKPFILLLRILKKQTVKKFFEKNE